MLLDQTQDFQIWGTMTPSYWVAWILSIPMWLKSPRERDFPVGNLISRQKQSRLQDCVGVCVHGCVPVHAHLCICTCIPMETRGPPQLFLLKHQLPCILGWLYWQCQGTFTIKWEHAQGGKTSSHPIYIVSGAGVKDAPCLLISTPEQREAEGAAYTWWTGYRK